MGRRRKAWLVNGNGALVQRGKRLPGYYGGAFAVGAGGKVDRRMDVRVKTNQDEQLEDFGW